MTLRAYAVGVGRMVPVGAGVDLSGPVEVAETAKVGLCLCERAGLLVLQSRRPRVGGVILDLADLTDEAVALLRRFVAAAGGG